MLLGSAVVDGGFHRFPASGASFAGLSANPGALVTERTEAPPCPDCADSYGVAARLNAGRDRRMSDAFRDLGRIGEDAAMSPDPVDDYRYGGRLPDPELRPEPRPLPRQVAPATLSSPPAPPATPPEGPQQKGPGEPPEPVAVPQ